MPIYFHSCLCSYLSRVPILVEDTICVYIYIYTHTHIYIHTHSRSKDFLLFFNVIYFSDVNQNFHQSREVKSKM